MRTGYHSAPNSPLLSSKNSRPVRRYWARSICCCMKSRTLLSSIATWPPPATYLANLLAVLLRVSGLFAIPDVSPMNVVTRGARRSRARCNTEIILCFQLINRRCYTSYTCYTGFEPPPPHPITCSAISDKHPFPAGKTHTLWGPYKTAGAPERFTRTRGRKPAGMC